MQKIEHLGAMLSDNPKTKVVDHPQGLNGKVNEASNGNLFYVAKMLIDNGVDFIEKSQLIWANANNRFPVSAEDYTKRRKGTFAEGELITFPTAEYTIENADGKKNIVTHTTLLVLAGQDKQVVFDSWSKRQFGTQPAPIRKTSGLPDIEVPAEEVEEA